ncbi:hypothetical protein [Pontibacter cellulosilyticus]|uniref:Glycosyltransferase RgtA/B/C/D-like domain-containing protein n=1 Tax=Pontibacter cellulosilyticus TaxID=1720253 RepID=A0A923N8E1_9BACT|nr:hypothetical protein [Pontibacter cellulosilyticus]MBC5994800.1 hypothetical protein [Pontibacter cellulosilyticus]
MSFIPKTHSFFSLSEERLTYCLVPAWLLMQVILYYWYGIRIVYDSHRYFAYADALASNTADWYLDSAKFYTSYTLLLAFFLHVAKLPVVSVLLFQTLVSGAAAVFLFKSTIFISGSRKAAIFATLFFILWPDLQFWNLYVHTESLYISLSVFILYFVLVARQRQQYLTLAVLLAIICFLRPNGFFVALAVAAALVFRRGLGLYFRSRYSRAVAATVLLFVLIAVAAFFLEIFSPIGYYTAGRFIQGYSGYTSPVVAPAPAGEAWVIQRLFTLMLEQPVTFIKLLAGRFLLFWAQIRPYYSVVHNVVILLFFLPLYYFAGVYLYRAKATLFTVFFLILAALHTLMVTVIAVDWDNRFIVPLLPFVFILAATGMVTKLANHEG